MSATRRPEAEASTRCCRPACRDSGRPAPAGSCAFSASATSCTREAGGERAARDRRTTSISRVSLESTSTLADAGHARQRRPHDVERVVAQVGRGQRAGQVEAEDREGRGRQALDGEIGLRRQLAARSATRLCACCSATQHVGGRIELRRDLGRAAEGRAIARGGCPGTSISACSSGRVTVSIIERAGVVPPCAMTTMRGNCSGG